MIHDNSRNNNRHFLKANFIDYQSYELHTFALITGLWFADIDEQAEEGGPSFCVGIAIGEV